MESNEFINNHFNLSKLGGDFVSAQLNDSLCLSAQKSMILRGNIPFIYEELREQISPWPVIIRHELKEEFEEVTRTLSNLLLKSVNLLQKNYPEIYSMLYSLPSELQKYITKDFEPFKDMVGRYDAVTSSSNLKVVEYNAGSSIGGWHLYKLADTYKEIIQFDSDLVDTTIIIEKFFFYLSRIGKELPESTDKLNVLFELSDPVEIQGFTYLLPLFEEILKASGLNMKLYLDASFKNINFMNDNVYFEGDKIDIVVAPIFPIDPNNLSVQKLTHLHFSNKVIFPDNPVYMLAGNKLNFAGLYLLLKNNHLTSKESSLVVKYLPWTGYLNEEIGSKITYGKNFVDDKNQYLIKKDISLGGKEVFIGKHMSQADWVTLLEKSKKEKGWVIQEFYPSDKYYAPQSDMTIGVHDYVWGFFDFGGEYGGCGVRLLPSETSLGVINSAKGAHYTMVFETNREEILI